MKTSEKNNTNRMRILLVCAVCVVWVSIICVTVISTRKKLANNDTKAAENANTENIVTEKVNTEKTTTEKTTTDKITTEKTTTEEAETTTTEVTTEATTESTTAATTEAVTETTMSEEQVITAVMNYCYEQNPSLLNMSQDEYYYYWDLTNTEGSEYTVTFRSYTGAFIYYHVNKISGETYTTEYVPGIVDEESPGNEYFNAWDYL
jgi:cytoskeletal protein RodZ